ncbi:MAG TPA: sigma-54 dependent transcriptional regulator [Thermoanaerobaculia bacterium]|jgi:DNA-binding NtrC family response regulator
MQRIGQSGTRRAAFTGDSRPIADLRRLATRLADFPFPILISGETGTGKYELARHIHEKSRRAGNPFIDVHCANLTPTLFEAELFGHERGAFTDARDQRTGRAELAGRGTLLFDEIDCLDPTLQAKLLRLVDHRLFERVGGRETLSCDAALIFTTNRDLWQMVAQGTFRADLLARISWSPLFIPALREHREDITFLAGMFLEEARARFNLPQVRWDTGALRLLCAHDWPGNVRELKSITYLAAYLHEGNTIHAERVESLLAARHSAIGGGHNPALDLADARLQSERDVIAEALRRTDGNRVHAARMLNIGRRTLQGKIAKYGL